MATDQAQGPVPWALQDEQPVIEPLQAYNYSPSLTKPLSYPEMSPVSSRRSALPVTPAATGVTRGGGSQHLSPFGANDALLPNISPVPSPHRSFDSSAVSEAPSPPRRGDGGTRLVPTLLPAGALTGAASTCTPWPMIPVAENAKPQDSPASVISSPLPFPVPSPPAQLSPKPPAASPPPSSVHEEAKAVDTCNSESISGPVASNGAVGVSSSGSRDRDREELEQLVAEQSACIERLTQQLQDRSTQLVAVNAELQQLRAVRSPHGGLHSHEADSVDSGLVPTLTPEKRTLLMQKAHALKKRLEAQQMAPYTPHGDTEVQWCSGAVPHAC